MWGLNAWSTEPDHAKSHHSGPDRAEPNQGMCCQIIMYKQKREQSSAKVNWHSLRFWDFVHHLILEADCLSFFRQAPNLVDLWTS